LSVVVTGLLAAALASGSPPAAEETLTHTRWVVGLTADNLWSSTSDRAVADLVAHQGATLVRRLRQALVLDIPTPRTNARGWREALLARPGVRYVEAEAWLPVAYKTLTAQDADDPLFAEQWTLHATADPRVTARVDIAIEAAWTQSNGIDAAGRRVRVAVLDDGFDLLHPDLRFVGGYDVSANEGESGYDFDPTFGSGDFHGTETAGVIAAKSPNALGITGVCPACELVPVRLIGNGGPTDLYVSGSAIAAAFEWAAFVAEADVINNSWGPPDGNPLLPGHTPALWPPASGDRPAGALPTVVRDALYQAARFGRGGRGCVITWSAGNGNELVTYDAFASHPLVLAIGSIDASGKRAYYSDFGPPLFLVAPSSGDSGMPWLWTTDITGSRGQCADDYCEKYGGTSAAAALVAGAAALVIAAHSELTAAQVAEALASGAHGDDARCPGEAKLRSPYWGWGRLDAAQAVLAALGYRDEHTYALELCGNDQDDNGNGVVDDPQQCVTCVPDTHNGELCDGRDNDCDAAIDEDYVCLPKNRPLCAPCQTSAQCQTGYRCRSNPGLFGSFCLKDCLSAADVCPVGFACDGEACVLSVDPSVCGRRDCADYIGCGNREICDGQDNDCNHLVDDIDPASPEAQAARRACGELGECAKAEVRCVDRVWQCELPATVSPRERCGDGHDNDCDGVVDNGCARPGGCGATTACGEAALALVAAGLVRALRRREPLRAPRR
jgi:subtilisin family serine protease